MSFFPTIYFCENVVEVVIAGKGKSMGKFKLGRAPSFECRVLTSWAKKTPRTVFQFGWCVHTLRLCFDSRFGRCGMSGSSIIILHSHGSSSCVYPSHSESVCFPLVRLWLLCCSIILNYRVYETLLLVFKSKSGVAESPCGCGVVYPGSGLNYVQDLGMGET